MSSLLFKFLKPSRFRGIHWLIQSNHVRLFSLYSNPLLLKKTQFPPRPKINEDDIEEVFIKGG